MTPSRRRLLLVDDIRAYAAQLTDSYRAHETLYTKTRGGRIKLVGVHTETHDGLLAQLADVAVHGVTSSTDNPGARPVPQSTPPATGRPSAAAPRSPPRPPAGAGTWTCRCATPPRATSASWPARPVSRRSSTTTRPPSCAGRCGSGAPRPRR
ncbi:hypothetical protein GCM10029963_53360 [Micromonospora andamanensis]